LLIIPIQFVEISLRIFGQSADPLVAPVVTTSSTPVHIVSALCSSPNNMGESPGIKSNGGLILSILNRERVVSKEKGDIPMYTRYTRIGALPQYTLNLKHL
jgi:hypothetical protein